MPGNLLGDLATPALVLGADPGALPAGVTYAAPGEPVPDRKWATVLLTVPDATALRRAVSDLPDVGRARHVVCRLARAERHDKKVAVDVVPAFVRATLERVRA